MKLTTLNKLEKQLRASRGREVPDLKPPPGGWEAINAKLTADPVGERAPVDQPTIPSWIKWWGGGAGVLLLVLAAVYMPPEVKAPREQAGDSVTQQALTMAKARKVDAERTAEMPVARQLQEQDEKLVRNNEETDLPAMKSGEVNSLADKGTAIEQTQERIAQKSVATEKEEEAPMSRDRPSVSTTNTGVGAEMNIPKTAPELPKDKQGAEVNAADTTNIDKTIPKVNSEVFADISREVYLPLALSSPFTGLELPAAGWPKNLLPEVPQKRGVFKRRRLKARPEWQFHGSISGFVGEDFDGTLAYDVAAPGSSEVFFIRPSGGLIHVEPDAERGHSNRLEQIYLKAGLNRQTSSGFLFRSSIGLFQSKSFQIGAQGELMADQVEVKTAKHETIIPIELGLQYTFLRRRRIKPYAGVHLIGYLNYLGVDESYFTEGATAEEGLVSRYSSQEFIALTPDLAVTLGLQYQISSRISAGAFLWGNIGGNFFVQAPLGMEIRYSLK